MGPPVIIFPNAHHARCWIYLTFLFYSWLASFSYVLMQACWQNSLVYIFWTIALGQIHQHQPSLKSNYIPRNTTIMRSWRRNGETPLNLLLTGQNINWVTIYYTGSSWTISKQTAPDWKRTQHDLLKREPQNLYKNHGRKVKAPQGTQRWELSSTASSTLRHKSVGNQTSRLCNLYCSWNKLPPHLQNIPAMHWIIVLKKKTLLGAFSK